MTTATPDLPDGYPLDRRGLQVGDRVRLIQLEDWFVTNLPADDAAFLKTCVGQTAEVQGFSDCGQAELEFERAASAGEYRSHTIWVDPSCIEKV